MNEINRLLIVLAAALWIVLMAVIIFLAWAAPADTIDTLGDFVEFLDDNDSTSGQLIVSLAALAAATLALLIIIVELAPEDEPKELRVEQAGATTIVPADALRARLEEALLSLPDVTAARSHVTTRDKGISASLDLTVTQSANVAGVTQEATRLVVDTIQSDLGLPVAGVPSVKIAFGGSRSAAVASSMAERPRFEDLDASAAGTETQPSLSRVETVDERMAESPPPATGHADSSPGPLVYGESLGAPDEPGADQPERREDEQY